MIFLDLYIFIQHFLHVRLFDSYDSHTLVNSNFLLIWTLKNVAVFIIIYYTFRKVSKKYMNKELWLNLLKFFFSISIVVIILFGLLLLFRPNQKDKDFPVEYLFVQINTIKLYSDPTKYHLYIVLTIEVFLFCIFMIILDRK